MEVRYLQAHEIQALHDEQIETYSPEEDTSVWDWNLLESAAQKPAITHYYEQDSDLCDLAAALAYGLTKNHAFVNANKRTAASAADIFMRINGHVLEFSPAYLVSVVVQIATGQMTQKCLSKVIRDHCRAMNDAEIEELQLMADQQ